MKYQNLEAVVEAEAEVRPRGAGGVLVLVLVVVRWWYTEVWFPDILGLKDPKPLQ